MELRGNHITVAELLADPRSRAVFQRRFGRWMKHPVPDAAPAVRDGGGLSAPKDH